MDAVLEVVGAGHAARQEAAIKVRQPLPALLVHTREPGNARVGAAASRSGSRRVERQSRCSRWATPGSTCRTPFGRICGRLVPAWVSGSMLSAMPLPCLIPAKWPHVSEPGVISSSKRRRAESRFSQATFWSISVRLPGYAAAQGPRSTVVLDTTLTPALIEEGLARDFVRGIQDARKQAGYRIEDTIEIEFVADPEVCASD